MNTMVEVFIDSKESGENKYSAQLTLNADVKNLPHGDFWVISETRKVTIERKTWGDAYNSWRQKRLQEQVSRLLEATEEGFKPILLIEGSWADIYSATPESIKGLQQHLNRLSVEAIPVIYTDDLNETFRYINSVVARLKDDSFGTLVRPVTVVSGTSNKHHALLRQIPKVGRQSSHKIYEHYDSLKDFVNNWEENPCMNMKTKTWNSINDFVHANWKAVKQEIIKEVK